MMKLRMLRETTPFNKIILTVFVMVVSAMLMTILGFLVARIFWGIGFLEVEGALSDFSDEKHIVLMKVFQMLQSVGIFILPPLVVAYLLSNTPRKFLQLHHGDTLKGFLMIIAAVYFANPFITWLGEINAAMALPEWLSGIEDWMRASEEQAAGITEAFLRSDSIGGLLFNLFLIGILPAVGEELLFRGVIQKLINQWSGNHHLAIWITAAVFSALHLQFFGFLPRLVLGAMFGYFLVWSGSLWVPIVAHFINNATAVLFFTLSGKEDPTLLGEGNSFLALVSLLFVGVLMRSYYLQVQFRRKAEDSMTI